jgi:hypothetical protein
MSVSGFAELVLLLACAPLNDGAYLGEPLLTVEGEILQQVSLSELEGEPTATAIWTPGATDEPGAPTPLQHEQVWVRTRFPSEYTLHLFDVPPEGAVHAAQGDPDRQVATGTVVLFMDLDADGVIDWGDEGLIGAAEGVLVNWNEEDGYGLAQLPEDCSGPGFVPADQEEDDVDLIVSEDVCETIVDPDCNPGSAEWGEDCGAHHPG